MTLAETTFAGAASAGGTTTLKRPNCLKFKTKNELKTTEFFRKNHQYWLGQKKQH